MATEETTNNAKNEILFFDNEPFLVRSLTLNLKLFGWQVKLVHDIDKLFYELRHNYYSILILDIKAPIPKMNSKNISFEPSEIDDMVDGLMTGVVVAKKIWVIENKKYEDIPILFHSAKKNPIYEDKKLLEQNIRKKCDYIRKPEKAKNIHQKLQDLLNQNNHN